MPHRVPTLRRHPPLLATLALCALGACASSPAAGRAPVEQTRSVVTSSSPVSGDIELVRDTRLAAHRTGYAPDRVWAALPAAFADLGLAGGPQAGTAATARTYVASATGLRRQLNKVPLSRYLECGTTATGASGADVHLIRLQTLSIVEPDGQGTRVRTQVLARATPTEGAAGLIDCSTTGVLEARLAEQLEARLR